jgi:hypothetical protein
MQQSIIAAGASREEAVLLVTEFSGEILARKGSLRQIQTHAQVMWSRQYQFGDNARLVCFQNNVVSNFILFAPPHSLYPNY